jgi:Rieske Fe-S protein
MALVDGFSHLAVKVTDLDRSEKFYREVFGLDLVGRNLVNEEGPNALLGMNTRQRILLIQVPEVEPFRPNSNSIHHAWYLTPEQFDRAQKRLSAMGFDIADSRKDFRALGERSMDVFDPDGHRYQVQAYGPEATQVIVEDVGDVDCGNVKDYAVGDVKVFVKGRFFLVRQAAGFIALSRWCTHMNGLLTWKKEHWQFYCPMHGAAYDRKGGCVSYGRTMAPLRVHPLRIAADGTITVSTDKVIPRTSCEPSDFVAPPASAAAVAAAN